MLILVGLVLPVGTQKSSVMMGCYFAQKGNTLLFMDFGLTSSVFFAHASQSNIISTKVQ